MVIYVILLLNYNILFLIVEQQNHLLQSLDVNSAEQQNISEKEWDKIKQEKDQILSLVSDSKKEKFESSYSQLDQFFQAEWEQIYVTTQEELSVLKSFFEMDKNERNILQDSLDFFWNSQEILDLQDSLQECGLDITDALTSYKDFIENQLILPENSQITEAEHTQLINNIRTLVVTEFLQLNEEIQSLKDDNDGSMENMQWEANNILKDALSHLTESLFPSAIFYLQMSRPEISSQIINAETKGSKKKLHAGMRIREIHSGLVSDSINIGDSIPKGLIDNDSFFTLNSVDNERYDNFLMKDKISWGGKSLSDQVQGLKEITFLNEQDKQIEEEAMVACLALIWACCVPYMWAVPSIFFDIQDTFSSQDAMLCFLKDHNIVPQEYHMDKAFYENIIAAVWVFASVVWLQAAAKSAKLAKVVKKLNNSNIPPAQISHIMNKVWDALGLTPKDSEQFLSHTVWNNLKNIPDNSEKSLKRNEWLALEDIIHNSSLSDAERYEWLQKDFPELNENQIEKVIDIHNHLDWELFQHSTHEWWEKLRAMRDVGIDRKLAIKIMDYGYAGKMWEINVKKDISYPEGFFETFNISKFGDLAHNLNMLPQKVSGEMNLDKMKKLVQFMGEYPSVFTRYREQTQALKFRISVMTDHMDVSKMNATYGKIDQKRIDNILDNIWDYKAFSKHLTELIRSIKTWDSSVVPENKLAFLGIPLWPDGWNIKNDFLYYASKNRRENMSSMHDAIISRIEQIQQDMRKKQLI